MESGEISIINPRLRYGYYGNGGYFIVPNNFCKKSGKFSAKYFKYLFKFYIIDQYCIEISPLGNQGDAISIFQNHRVIDKTPERNSFHEPHMTCFDFFDDKKDMFELRNGGTDGVRKFLNTSKSLFYF